MGVRIELYNNVMSMAVRHSLCRDHEREKGLACLLTESGYHWTRLWHFSNKRKMTMQWNRLWTRIQKIMVTKEVLD